MFLAFREHYSRTTPSAEYPTSSTENSTFRRELFWLTIMPIFHQGTFAGKADFRRCNLVNLLVFSFLLFFPSNYKIWSDFETNLRGGRFAVLSAPVLCCYEMSTKRILSRIDAIKIIWKSTPTMVAHGIQCLRIVFLAIIVCVESFLLSLFCFWKRTSKIRY